MERIKDILALDFSQDIKDVINVEDQNESEIQYEVENYIITETISDFFNKFINQYQSNIKETGVWISGFYGSGKSYFGKMLGYLLENKTIKGTPFRERFIQRLKGLDNKNLLENSIRSLETYQSKIVFLDIAKQHTRQGFAWTLFSNFLRELGFLDNVFGYLEYLLFVQDNYKDFLKNVKNITGEDWLQLRKNSINVPKTIKKVLIGSDYFTESVYDDTKKYLEDKINSFNANLLKDELDIYLSKFPDNRVVFIIDELSEAILTEKVKLLDLEGISESLSALPMSRVWTIAIAQEYLDNLIESVQYVSHKEVNKVIDRFKLKISLSSDDIDTIIKERLLKKKDEGVSNLEEIFKKNSGEIIDLTTLKSKISTKTSTPDEFATYYPFHHYQFKLLNNFIQAVYTKTRVTERGLIIAIYSVLKEINKQNLFKFATAYNLADGAKQNIDSDLAKKFTSADQILKDKGHKSVNGAQLLKTIYFINESAQIEANTDNITKLYLNEYGGYYAIKPDIEKALNDLCDTNLLLNKNNSFAITSDLERAKIEEMKAIDVPLYDKKREFTVYLKRQDFIKDLSRIYFDSNNYGFNIATRQGEEIFKHTKKDVLKIQIESMYSIEPEKIDTYINQIKFEMNKSKDTAVLIPIMNKFKEIDRKITEIYRYKIMEDRYQNDNDLNLRAIIRDFSQNRDKREKEIDSLIAEAYHNGTIIYDFVEKKLNKDGFKQSFSQIQEKMISNTFTERIPVQFSEGDAVNILKTDSPSSLSSYLPDHPEARFFDSNGNFIGSGLRIIENINDEISQSYVSGTDLEDKFGKIPYGYDYAAIVVSLAAMMRAGRLSVRYNGRTIHDYHDPDIRNVFSISREFRKASYKAISSTITATQKQKLVDNLKELESDKILHIHFDYNTNELELAEIISNVSNHYLEQIEVYQRRENDFSFFFPNIYDDLKILREYSQKITADNFKETIERFLDNYSHYKQTINNIKKIIAFCEKDLENVKKYQKFVKQVKHEIDKVESIMQDNQVFSLIDDFNQKYNSSVFESFPDLEKIFQNIKDGYYRLMESEHEKMVASYLELQKTVQKYHQEIASISEHLNRDILDELNRIVHNAGKYVCDNLQITFDTKCENCHFSLNEIIFANQSADSKNREIENIGTQIKYPEPDRQPKEIRISIRRGKFSVSEYKTMLQEKINEADNLDKDSFVIIE